MPKVVDHEQRRSEIAMALWLVIYEQGIDGVSFRSVAQAAGVSVGRLQHYFSSKEELVLHGCRQMIASAVEDHGTAAIPEDPRAAREELLAHLSGSLREGEEFRTGASVWAAYQAKAVSDPALEEIVAGAMHEREGPLAELLASARRVTEAGGTRTASTVPTAADRTDALRLAALSEGLTQRVLVGALPAQEARDVLRAEVDRCLER
jgi:AcrR family transcriptional regulator